MMEFSKKLMKENMELATNYAEEIKMMASSLVESIADATTMTQAWNSIDRFYQDVEALRNRQKCTGSKSFSILESDVEGHTKYLQGLNLPIMINSITTEGNDELTPSKVCEMHIGNVDDKCVLLITPEIIG